MKKTSILLYLIISFSATYAQIGINDNGSAPHPSAQLDVKSTTKAFYPPRMTTSQKNAIASPQAGAVVFDNTLNQLSFYNGSAWVAGAGLALPYSATQSLATGIEGGLFKITNSYGNDEVPDNAIAINGTITGPHGAAIRAIATNTEGMDTDAIYASNSSTNSNGTGLYASHAGGGKGVQGYSKSGEGVYGFSNSGVGGFFRSSGTGYALITESGNVGIGTLTPAAKMVIKGSENLSLFYLGANEDTYLRGGIATSNMIINDLGNKIGLGVAPNLRAEEKVDINGRLRIRSSTAGTAGVWFNNTGNSILTANGAFHGMKTDTETGIWINDAWRFWVNSLGNATLLGTLTQSSDRRLKKDFSLLNNSLTDIYKLSGYHFRWIEEARNKELQTGLIAQEVQKIFPELVQTDDKGFLSVNYIGLIPHLIEAVKELKNENNSLKLENNLIKTENNSFKNNQTKLESRIDKMESLLNSFSKNTASN